MKKCSKIIGLIILLFTFIPLFGQNNSIGDMEGMLERHNFYRTEVGTPPLQWSNKLAKNALKWANILKEKNCLLKHSPQNMRKGYGENIAWNSGYSEIFGFRSAFSVFLFLSLVSYIFFLIINKKK